MKKSLSAGRAALLCLFLLSTFDCAVAQETRGQIFGSVQDASGSVLVAVTVKAVNLGTGVETVAVSNDQGEYILPLLLPGEYRVTAEQPGFKRFVREGIAVRVSDRIPVDIRMEIGQVTETVHVQAEAPLLETATASMGQVIDNRRIAELPLKDGNPIMLANLAPGVINLSTGGWSRPFDVNSPSSIATDGTRTGNTEFSLDGAPNIQRTAVAYIPPADIVQEFKIQTASFDASLGFATGAAVNVSIKSGTNDLHGTLYHFLQNPVLNANRFFTNRAGLPKPIVRLNRWGTSGTGPVRLPKLYDGLNRTFWTYAYEGIYSADPRGTIITAVPTAAQRQGDFSSLLRLGTQYQIYDPATIAPAPNGRFSRQPLPGNLLPASRINATARKLMEFWPEPNTAGTADGSNNWTTPGPEWDRFHSHIFRVDHNFGARHRMFLRGDKNDRLQQFDVRFNNAVGGQFQRRNRGLAVDDVYVFNPSLILNTRYSYGRFIEGTRPINLGIDLVSLGFSQTFANQIRTTTPDGVKFPNIRVSGYGSFGDHTHNSRFTETHEWAANFTQLVRSHNLRYGLVYRVLRENAFNRAQSSGQLDFATDWTRGPLDSSPGAPMGQSLASFLLGLPTGGGIDVTDSYAEQSKVGALYFHDDWKVTSKLTLSLGLRYEWETPVTERFNRSVRGFDFSAASPIQDAARANYAQRPIPEIPPSEFRVVGGLTFASLGGQPRELWSPDRNNWMPRFGFAYQMDSKTVWRGGYGIFYELLGLTRQQVNQTGFSRNTALVPSIDNGLSFAATLTNPFPDGLARPLGAAGGLSTFLGQGVSFFNSRQVNPYMQRWQLSLQRQLLRDSVLEVGYIGNRGTDLRIGRQLNPIPRQYYSTSGVRDQAAIDFQSAAVPNPFFPLLPRTSLAGSNTTRSQLLRPHPHFTSVAYNHEQGYSWYHSMQTRFEKRFRSSYTVNLSWTWSKFMEATGYLNDTDPVPERVISDQDRTHRVVITGLWELPFGPGRRWGHSAGAGKLIGGWQVQAIYQRQSGPPVGFGNAIFNGSLAAVPLSSSQRSVDRWFNVDAGFERNSARQLGANLRAFPTRFSGIRGDVMDNWDISLFKNTSLSERARLQFRAEFINAFNHAQFNPPNTTPSSTAFGRLTGESQWSRTIQFALKLVL